MNTKKFVVSSAIALAAASLPASTLAATVTYTQQTSQYDRVNSNASSGGIYDGTGTVGMWMDGDNTSQGDVAWKTFRTGSSTVSSTRDLQIGDAFTITLNTRGVYYGSIGVSLNDGYNFASGNFANRLDGSRVAIIQNGGNFGSGGGRGSWFVDASSDTSFGITPNSVAQDYVLTFKITSGNTANVRVQGNGGDQTLYDVVLNGASGVNIDSYSIWLSDDRSLAWNDNSGGRGDTVWKQTTTVENTGAVELGYAAASGVTRSFGTVISDGLQADSTSTTSANSVYVGGDAGSQVNLSANNTYTGGTTVNANATLEIQHANALGSTSSGTTVTDGAALKIYHATGINVGESISLNGIGVSGAGGALINTGGANEISGNITLGANSRIQSFAGSLDVSGNIGGGNNVLFVGGANNSSVSGAISGAGNTQDGTATSLFKDGEGTLTLSGNNTYTGDTRVTEGRVIVATGGNLGSGSDVFVSDGAILALNASTTIASVQEAGNNNGGEVAIGSGATLTINGENKGTMLQDTISGAGNLVVNGSGTTSLALYGTQSWSGTTTLSGGKLSTGVALSTSGLTISGGTFETSAADILGSIAVALSSGTYSLGGADTVDSFSITGGEISGANTLTAATYALNGGTVTANLGNGAATATSGETDLDGNLGGSLTANGGTVNAGGTIGGNVTVGGGTVNLGGDNRIDNGSAVSIMSGTLGMSTFSDEVGSFAISGGTLGGSGTLTASTYALNGGAVNAKLGGGAVTVATGTTTLGSAGRLNSASSLTVNSGQLTLGGNETVASLAGSGGTIALGNGSLTLGGNSYSNSYAGVISGNGSLIKNGTGTLTLSGENSYTGGTMLNGGTLDADSSSAFGTGSVTVGSGTILDLLSHDVSNLIVNNGGTVLSSGILSDVDAEAGETTIGGNGSTVTQAAGTATVTVTASDVIISNVAGSAQVNIAGTGAAVETVSGGTVTLSNSATGASVNAASAGTVNANAAGVRVGTISSAAVVNVGGTNGRVATLAGGTLNANAAGLVITNKTGGNLAVSNGVTVGLRGGNSSGVISGAGGIAKQGATTLTLSGVNTYSGATTVEEGKLVVNGSITNSSVTVQGGAKLGGSGAVGSTTLLSGASINPGNSPGTITNIGDLTWSGGASYDWEIFNVSGTPGSEWDLIDVTGELLFSSISSTNQFNINIFSLSALPSTVGPLAGWNSATNYSWTILTAGANISGFDASNFNLNLANFTNNNSLDGGAFSLAVNGGDLNLLFEAGSGPGPQPVPEPGTWVAAALLAGAAGYVRWRRRQGGTKSQA